MSSNEPQFDPDNTDAKINAALDEELPDVASLNLAADAIASELPNTNNDDSSPPPQPQTKRRTLSEFKISKSFDTSPPPPETRPRAEEINSGAKLLPKIESSINDFFGFEIEIEKWFGTFDDNLPEWYNKLSVGTETELKLHEILDHPNAKVSELSQSIQKSSLQAVENNWISKIELPTCDFSSHTLLFILLTSIVSHSKGEPPIDSKIEIENGVRIISGLMEQIASLRWSVSDEDNEFTILRARLFRLLRMSMMAVLGDTTDDLSRVKRQIWEDIYGMKSVREDVCGPLSPLSYVEFIESIQQKYPAFVPECNETHKLGLYLKFIAQSLNTNQLDDTKNGSKVSNGVPTSSTSLGSTSLGSTSSSLGPTSLASSMGTGVTPSSLSSDDLTSAVPYIPTSITEASELYKQQSEPSPKINQLRTEILNTESKHKTYENKTLETITELYKSTLKFQKSFVSVAMDSILHSCKRKSVFGVHSVVSSLWHLISWFDLGHILMRENLTALLFDCQYHFVAHIFCESFQDILNCILEPYSKSEVWNLASNNVSIDQDVIPKEFSKDRANLVIENFNKFHLQMYINVLQISRSIMEDKPKRILVVAALPFGPWKQLFTFYQKELWTELLLFIKLQVPFMGKRWRYMNMELISAIYMYCPTKLDDNWLYGKDLTKTVQQAPLYETLIRNLVHKFNDQFS